MLDEPRLRRVLEVGRTIVSELDLEAVLRRALDVARELTGARYAALGILDAQRRELERFLTVGVDEPTQREIGDRPRGRGVLGLLIHDPRPLRLDDVSAHPHSYGFPPGHPRMRTFLGVPVLVRGEAFGNLYLSEKDGGQAFDDADEEVIVLLAGWVGTAIDNARSYTREQARRQEIEQSMHALEATTAIARALGGETDLARIIELIVKRARALVEARSVVILLLDGDELVVQAVAGHLDEGVVGVRVDLDDSVSGHVLQRRLPERLGDVTHRLRHALAPYVKARTGLFVPMIFRGRPIGVLIAYDRGDGREFTSEDERLLEAFAASAATAVATAQSAAEQGLRRSIEASEHERRRWARELHDETLQQMGAVDMLLAGAARSHDPEAVAGAIRAAREQLAEGIVALRRLIVDLRPAALDELGVKVALEGLVERVSGASGLDISLRVDLDFEQGRVTRRHSPLLEETLYRLVQEALNNVVKHARATSAQVSVVERRGIIEMTIRDDGRGIAAAAGGAPGEGFGLLGMRERVALAGGTLDVRPAPGHGTVVRATLPTRRPDPASAAAAC